MLLDDVAAADDLGERNIGVLGNRFGMASQEQQQRESPRRSFSLRVLAAQSQHKRDVLEQRGLAAAGRADDGQVAIGGQVFPDVVAPPEQLLGEFRDGIGGGFVERSRVDA